jgi:chromosome segregation ATPase
MLIVIAILFLIEKSFGDSENNNATLEMILNTLNDLKKTVEGNFSKLNTEVTLLKNRMDSMEKGLQNVSKRMDSMEKGLQNVSKTLTDVNKTLSDKIDELGEVMSGNYSVSRLKEASVSFVDGGCGTIVTNGTEYFIAVARHCIVEPEKNCYMSDRTKLYGFKKSKYFVKEVVVNLLI